VAAVVAYFVPQQASADPDAKWVGQEWLAQSRMTRHRPSRACFAGSSYSFSALTMIDHRLGIVQTIRQV